MYEMGKRMFQSNLLHCCVCCKLYTYLLHFFLLSHVYLSKLPKYPLIAQVLDPYEVYL